LLIPQRIEVEFGVNHNPLWEQGEFLKNYQH
jgi:hypothetical protein